MQQELLIILITAIVSLVYSYFPFSKIDATPLPTVPYVNLTLLSGQWYQWAHLPSMFRNGDYCAYFNFSNPSDSNVNWTLAYKKSNGETPWLYLYPNVTNLNTTNNAEYHVTYSLLDESQYWIIALDEDYTNVLLGAPDRKSAMILNRDNLFNQTVFNNLSNIAGSLGFENTTWRYPYQGLACTP